MEFIKETKKVLGRIYKEHQFFSSTSTIFWAREESQIHKFTKGFSTGKVILVHHTASWIGFLYDCEQQTVTIEASMIKIQQRNLLNSFGFY